MSLMNWHMLVSAKLSLLMTSDEFCQTQSPLKLAVQIKTQILTLLSKGLSTEKFKCCTLLLKMATPKRALLLTEVLMEAFVV